LSLFLPYFYSLWWLSFRIGLERAVRSAVLSFEAQTGLQVVAKAEFLAHLVALDSDLD